MACAPSTVPMLGCCGEAACDWFFFDGRRRVHSGFLGVPDHFFETLSESATVSGLGAWFRNSFAPEFGAQIEQFETNGSHPGISVTFTQLSTTTLTDEMIVGPARFTVNGIDAGIAVITRTLTRRKTFRSVLDYTITAMADIRQRRLGAFRYNLFFPSRDDLPPRALVASNNIEDLRSVAPSVPATPSLPDLTQSLNATSGGGQALQVLASGVSVIASGDYCVATFTSNRSACRSASGGNFILFPEPPLLDTYNFATQRPPFYALITPNQCSLSQPFGPLCCS